MTNIGKFYLDENLTIEALFNKIGIRQILRINEKEYAARYEDTLLKVCVFWKKGRVKRVEAVKFHIDNEDLSLFLKDLLYTTLKIKLYTKEK